MKSMKEIRFYKDEIFIIHFVNNVDCNVNYLVTCKEDKL